MNKALTFDISPLIEASTGTSKEFSFSGNIDFEDLKTTSDISGRASVMRIEGGINATITDFETEVELTCEKCLAPFSEKIIVPSMERQFYFRTPFDIEDVNDIFLVDNKNLTIDLTEPLRQEIILHFPLIPVCSTGCKGLCPHCGKNRNKEKCDCKDAVPEEHKPLSILKDLLK